MRKLLLACLAIAALAVPALSAASGKLNTIEPKAKLGGDGERAKVTVLLACDHIQTAKLKVTVTQGSANDQERALGRGREKVECTTEKSGFPIVVSAKDGAFASGKATACALMLLNDDARQWCVEVKLVD